MNDLTVKSVAYPLSEEGIVQEAYFDSEHVLTWAGGVTSASGHRVERYRDNPQTLDVCLSVTIWLMRRKYLPAVLRAFSGFTLNEAQLAAALSFHWNTGKIERTDWVAMVKAGRAAAARAFLESHYTNDRTNDGVNNGALTDRRKREAALFFDGRWPSLTVPVYPVSKPSYTPAFSRGRRMDMSAMIQAVLAGDG